MIFSVPECADCGSPADGIIENLQVTATISTDSDEAPIVFEYDGDTRMHWDSQEPVKDSFDMVTLCCSQCNTEWSSELL